MVTKTHVFAGFSRSAAGQTFNVVPACCLGRANLALNCAPDHHFDMAAGGLVRLRHQGLFTVGNRAIAS